MVGGALSPAYSTRDGLFRRHLALVNASVAVGFGNIDGCCQELVAPLAMTDQSLLTKVHELSDLELAVLLCLISREHCLISTPSHVVDDLVLELQLVR